MSMPPDAPSDQNTQSSSNADPLNAQVNMNVSAGAEAMSEERNASPFSGNLIDNEDLDHKNNYGIPQQSHSVGSAARKYARRNYRDADQEARREGKFGKRRLRERLESLRTELGTKERRLRLLNQQLAHYSFATAPVEKLDDKDSTEEEVKELERKIDEVSSELEKFDESGGSSVSPSSEDEVEQWFLKDLQTPQDKYFVIALSMFNGLKWTDFWEIYQSILRAQKLIKDEKSGEADDLFARPDYERTERVFARIRWDSEESAEIIEFTDTKDQKSDMQEDVLNLLRQHYRPRLLELLPLLKGLGQHPYWAIRVRAAYGVAEIARLDFYRARSQVLEAWAKDDRPYVRAAVGYTASALVDSPQVGKNTSDLLTEWATPSQNGKSWKYPWTAASAYKQIGLFDPERALAGLKLAARNDDIRVADGVISALLVISLDDKLETVLTELEGWVKPAGTASPETVVPLVGVLAFLALANVYTAKATEEKDLEAPGDSVFDLMRQPTWRERAMTFFMQSLRFRLADEYLDILKGWGKQAAKNPVLSAALRDVIAEWYVALYKDNHRLGMEKLWNTLKRWSQDTDEAVKAVGEAGMDEIRQRERNQSIPERRQAATGTSTSSNRIQFGPS